MSSITERAKGRVDRRKEDRQPAYLAFAKVGGGWMKIGSAWRWRSGEDGLSIQLGTLPIHFDGRFVLAIPDRDPPDDDSQPDDR